MTYILIDPPVTPYSNISDIEAWITDLEQKEKTPEVERALSKAKSYLDDAKKLHADKPKQAA